jgi:hypothetical protein
LRVRGWLERRGGIALILVGSIAVNAFFGYRTYERWGAPTFPDVVMLGDITYTHVRYGPGHPMCLGRASLVAQERRSTLGQTVGVLGAVTRDTGGWVAVVSAAGATGPDVFPVAGTVTSPLELVVQSGGCFATYVDV